MNQESAVVIGATRNLGLYISQQLSAKGWSVVGVGRSSIETSATVSFVPMDLSLETSVETLAELLQSVSPRLIVCNAVVYAPVPSESSKLAEIESMFRVNALVPYLALSRYLNSARSARCVIINSDSIFHANRAVGYYAASKAALKILTTVLADLCRSNGNAVSTLLLGPLADERKMQECMRIAEQRGLSLDEVIKALLKRGNPFYLKESFLQFDECMRSIEYIYQLGAAANGMVCKLDGGSSGSLN